MSPEEQRKQMALDAPIPAGRKIHAEGALAKRESPVYALVVAKGGPKFLPFAQQSEASEVSPNRLVTSVFRSQKIP